MYKTKKEVDAHVRNSMSKLRTDKDRNIRGFAIAKLYYKVNDFASAEKYLLSYMTVNEDNDQAYKLLGQCYQRLKKPEQALQAYQRSLHINGKQPDILVEVCQLLLDDAAFNANKARYWCELAESEKVQHDAVFSLRLKMMNKGDMQSHQLEELIHKEIAARPKDVQLRVRLLRIQIEQNRINDAYLYVRKLELSQEHLDFNGSAEWQNIVRLVLNKYEQSANMKRDWDFWVLLISCLEKQVAISFGLSTASGCTETSNLLFEMDEYLYKISQLTDKFSGVQKEVMNVCLNHFYGQMLLHAASLLYKRELLQNKNLWKETVKTTLPLLFLSYQVEPPENKEPWMKHCDEQSKKLIQLWNRESAFRCAQAGRIILSCITEEPYVNKANATQQANNLLIGGTPTSHLWSNCDELLSQLRQYCSDKQWRKQLFSILFSNTKQRLKEQNSFLVKSMKFNEPKYDLPAYEDLERYEQAAQLLQPQSLPHMVYLSLGTANLADVRAHYFSGLSFSTQNLAFCGAESLNRLDIETFLYAAVIQAKRQLQIERDLLESYQSGNRNAVGKPHLLPFINMQSQLCSEEQASWWLAAYQVYKNLCTDNLAEIRAKLQHGIEAVRGINGTKVDMLIIFKLGKIFMQRAQDIVKPIEKAYLEARVETLYKHGLNMYKLHQKGVLEPYHKLFKYAKSNCTAVESEIIKASEDAVSYLAALYFKKGDYETFIEEFSGLQLPFATYMQAEAYRRLEEVDKTPKKGKSLYLERAFECLNQTLSLLKSTKTDPDHPLNSVVQSEMKNLHQAFGKYMFNNSNSAYNNTNDNNSSNYEDAEDSFNGELPSINTPGRRLSHNRRESSGVSRSGGINSDMEQIIKQMLTTLTFVRDELTDTIKPELSSMRQEIGSLKDKIAHLEDSIKTNQEQANVLPDENNPEWNDIFGIDNLMFPNRPVGNMPSNNSTPNAYMPPNPQQQQQQHQQQQAARMQQQNAMVYGGNPMFNANYAAMGYYGQSPYVMPQQGAAANSAMMPNPYATMPYVQEALAGMNFNMTSNAPSLIPQTPTLPLNPQDARIPASVASNNLYGLLTQSANNTLPQLPLSLPIKSPLVPPPVIQTTSVVASTTITSVAAVLPTFSTQSLPPTTAPSSAGVFNKALNNKPVEKVPPANVVITSSDPLPNPNVAPVQTQQAPLSVTIPSHHIKSTVASIAPIVAEPVFENNISTFGSSTFSFKPQVAQALQQAAQKQNDSQADDDDDGADAETEYDPQPDFKPIIPLPDEVEVKTGEEDEEVKFCSRAKLFRHLDKEWKERGIGNLKILKHPDGHSRIIMRRDQTFKVAANHKIQSNMVLSAPQSETKGFVWVANDFADGELKLEKFFVRFKLPETALEFKTAFELAVKEASELEKSTTQTTTTTTTKQELAKSSLFGTQTTKVAEKTTAEPVAPPVAVNNTFNKFLTSTPAGKTSATSTLTSSTTTTTTTTTQEPAKNSLFGNFNLASKTNDTAVKPKETVSPFAGFSFGNLNTSGSTTTPFANVFGSLNKDNADMPSFQSVAQTNGSDAANKSTHSEHEDDYVPDAQFKPVIPLPDLIEVNTGEENENVLFEHRAKLLRFDKSTTEWKERGLGNIKLLQDKNDINKLRLVMRREQVHKLCCNQRVYKDTKFMLANTAAKNAVSWAGPDYSENELVTETLTLRFKTADTTQEFLNAVQAAQSAMSADGEENNAKSLVQETNKEEAAVQGFGAQFKPKTGSWDCQACYVNNAASQLYCMACDTPKDDTVPKKQAQQPAGINLSTSSNFTFGFANRTITPASTTTASTTTATPFLFGKPATTVTPTTTTTTTTTVETAPAPDAGFGDKFKQKAGSWNCEGCYTNNPGTVLYCAACEHPKDNTVPKKEAQGGINLSSSSGTKFSFGFANQTVAPVTFGMPKDKNEAGDVLKSFNFKATEPALGKATFSFSMPMPGSENAAVAANNTTLTAPPFGLEKKEFNFSMAPKSPGSNKLNRSGGGGDADVLVDEQDEYNEEENNTYFTPVIPLPDKIEVKTGEEDEDVLYVHRAKLYRFVENEWKERGLGDVKILRHKQTKKLRVVMRREQIFKICLNHILNAEVEYKPMDEKSWLFVVNDFSEGSVEVEKLSLRFKNKEIAQNFITAVQKALDGTAVPVETSTVTISDITNNNTNISPADKELADKYKLPYSLYTTQTTCSGCRGCNDDKFVYTTAGNTTFKAEDETSTLPMELPEIAAPKSNINRSFLKESTLTPVASNTASKNDTLPKTPVTPFSFTAAAKENDVPLSKNLFGTSTVTQSSSGGSLFGSGFGNLSNIKSDSDQPASIFGGTNATFKLPLAENVFGSQNTNIFGGSLSTSTTAAAGDGKPIFGASFGSGAQPVFGGFGANNKTASNLFINKEKQKTEENNQTDNTQSAPKFNFGSVAGLDFASLAKANENKTSDAPISSFAKPPDKNAEPIKFVGLTGEDAFSSFQKKKENTDSVNNNSQLNNGNDSTQSVGAENGDNYDPYYAPIIQLPDEITVRTGEENETKCFGERAKLYRFTDNEWKERGVGELKILQHNDKKTYRLLMRREQVQKLVLNHAVGAEFSFNNMNNDPKSFVWAALNYAEKEEGELEKLAVRFGKKELADKFSNVLKDAIANAKANKKD